MGMTYVVHILAGTLGLIAGYVALYSAKGAALHRKSGMVFVYAMLFMAVFGMTIAVVARQGAGHQRPRRNDHVVPGDHGADNSATPWCGVAGLALVGHRRNARRVGSGS